MSPGKIIPFESAPAVFKKLRARGLRIVQCHGLFDLLHVGYVVHLQEARALGDLLVVTLTADKFVNKGPGRPFCKEQLRARALAALSCVDFVVIVPHEGAVEAIQAVHPHIFCRGKVYEKAPFKDELHERAVAAAQQIGARVCYVGSTVFSATKVLNHHFDHLPKGVKSFCMALAQDCSMNDFRSAVDGFGDLKVVVIGDTIFDRYSYVKVQGLTSKNRIISGRFLREEMQCGGALAVFRHVKQFAGSVKFVSLLGTEPWVEGLLRSHLSAEEDKSVRDPAFTTIIKQRYVEPLMEGKELSKLFALNYIDADPPARETQLKLEKRVRSEMRGADLVLLLDFGHGMMQPPLRALVQEEAPLLVLNCQTNSNNYGFNIISRQYQRAHGFSLDRPELMLSSGHRHLDFLEEIQKLRRSLGARYAWLTGGASDTIGLQQNEHCSCPPLETDVVDTIGAGDAFFSVAALAVARKLPIALATFLGQLAGAQAVKIVGNQHPISRQALVNSGLSLLNF